MFKWIGDGDVGFSHIEMFPVRFRACSWALWRATYCLWTMTPVRKTRWKRREWLSVKRASQSKKKKKQTNNDSSDFICIWHILLLLFLFSSKKTGGFGGMFGMLKGLVGSKNLTREDMESVLDKMKDHLIGRMQNPPRWCPGVFK